MFGKRWTTGDGTSNPASPSPTPPAMAPNAGGPAPPIDPEIEAALLGADPIPMDAGGGLRVSEVDNPAVTDEDAGPPAKGKGAPPRVTAFQVPDIDDYYFICVYIGDGGSATVAVIGRGKDAENTARGICKIVTEAKMAAITVERFENGWKAMAKTDKCDILVRPVHLKISRVGGKAVATVYHPNEETHKVFLPMLLIQEGGKYREGPELVVRGKKGKLWRAKGLLNIPANRANSSPARQISKPCEAVTVTLSGNGPTAVKITSTGDGAFRRVEAAARAVGAATFQKPTETPAAAAGAEPGFEISVNLRPRYAYMEMSNPTQAAEGVSLAVGSDSEGPWVAFFGKKAHEEAVRSTALAHSTELLTVVVIGNTVVAVGAPRTG